MNAASLTASAQESRRRSLKVMLPALVLGLAGWALLFHAEIAAAVRVWIDSTAYNHGFFVLPLAFWLAWDRRRAAAYLAPRPTAWPALAALPLGLAWFVADRLGIMEGRQLAALGLLETLLVAWLGWQLARAFAGPLMYLIFLVPFGAFLTPTLQSFTAQFIDVGLDIIGIPHVVSEFTIEIPQGRFFVAEACAGLRFLIAAVAFGALYALLMYRSLGRRLVFIAISCVVPVIANGLRALGIVVLGNILGSARAAAADHVIYGWGFFSAVILLLTAAGLPFREDGSRPPVLPRAPAETRLMTGRPLATWWAVAAVLALSAIGPAAAARIDQGLRAAPPHALSGFDPTGSCRVIDTRGAVRHFDCAGAPLTTTVHVLPAGSGPGVLRAALLAATDTHGAEDMRHGTLTIGRFIWRLTMTARPARITASIVFADGTPAAGGIATRLHLGWESVVGGGAPTALLVATLTPPDLSGPQAWAAEREHLRDFLANQQTLLGAAARISAGSGR